MTLVPSTLLLLASCAHGDGLPTTNLEVAGHPVVAEIADDAGERARGLQHRESLAADRGMLFVYPEAEIRSFWMAYTSIPLSIAFLDDQGRIFQVEHLAPLDRTAIPSHRPTRYALELNRGWFEAHGVGIGDRVSPLPEPSAR